MVITTWAWFVKMNGPRWPFVTSDGLASTNERISNSVKYSASAVPFLICTFTSSIFRPKPFTFPM